MSAHPVRRAEVADAPACGRLLHDFNREFGDPTPGGAAMADRVATLLEAGDTVILLGGRGPDGIAVLRLRPALWSQALDLPDCVLLPRP